MIIAGRQLWNALSASFEPGWLEVIGGRISRLVWEDFSGTPDVALLGFATPGLVDVHSHGAGGAAFTEGAAAARIALAAHLEAGTTTVIASLVTAGLAELRTQIEALIPLVENGELAGIHLEGPWISPKQRGAHDPDKLALPDAQAVEAVLGYGSEIIRMVTIAPELPGALEAISSFAAAGIVAAIGHTAADFAVTQAGVTAGATGVTHMFNAMPDLKKREPGPVLAALEAEQVFLELIFDGFHIDPRLAVFIGKNYPGRTVLITDAMAAAGLGDGDYALGGLPVTVANGQARISGTETIAGSTIRLADAVRLATQAGVPLAAAVGLATANPAAYLQIPKVGRLDVGFHADLVEFDADTLKVCRVMRRGQWR
ncbi:MAG: amidohydrolase family protein [Propionibacteriaceae bacterium]|jgi:N-acetylglucosamine-6-phosphate deacetylase|nr:amidohydrolase family protein [Propionibacteriaceae bacterium]